MLQDKARTVLIATFLIIIFCCPILTAPIDAWPNLLLLVFGFVIPILSVGLFFNKYAYSENSLLKFFLTLMTGGIVFSLLSSIVFYLEGYPLDYILINASIMGLLAVFASLVSYTLLIIARKIMHKKNK